LIASRGRRRAVRALAGALVGLPVGATVILAAAGSASADNAPSTITCPSPDGSTPGHMVSGSTESCTSVSGTVSAGTIALGATVTCTLQDRRICGSSTFTISPPSADSHDATISQSEIQPQVYRSVQVSKTLPAGAANGTWTATLTGGGADVSTSFVLAVPPSVPGDLSVAVATPGQATVSWSASSPTPATAYSLDVDGDPTTLTPACNGSTCSGTVTGLSAGSHSFSVIATRSDGGSGTVSSKPAVADGTVAPVSRASPSSPTSSSSGGGASGSGSSGPGSSGSGSSGSTGSTGTVKSGSGGSSSTTTTAAGTAAEAQRLAAAVAAAQKTASSFKSFSPPAGIALLPPLPQLPAAANPNGEPTDPGTYKPTLPYSGTVTERVQTTTRTTALGHIQNVVSDRQVAESAAAGLLVLLVAGHLRVLSRRTDTVDL
jgi:hypothetical protein